MTKVSVFLKAIIAMSMLMIASQVMSKNMMIIEDGWIPTAPPTMKMNAGYFKLVNHGHHQQILVSASSPNYKNIEFHTSEMTDGMVSMKKIEQVIIGSHQAVHFKPGGLHLMMHKPVSPALEGEVIKINLVFDGGATQEIELQVRKRQAQMKMQGHGHHH